MNGRACTNDIRVRRDTVEAVVLARVRDQLHEPSRVKAMIAEMQSHLTHLLKQNTARAAEAPRELKELDTRLMRLRGRLRDGDPDMAPDELQAAIDRVEMKRRQLMSGSQERTDVARMLSSVPRAAELCDERIALGLQSDKTACEEASTSSEKFFRMRG